MPLAEKMSPRPLASARIGCFHVFFSLSFLSCFPSFFLDWLSSFIFIINTIKKERKTEKTKRKHYENNMRAFEASLARCSKFPLFCSAFGRFV